jgi:hypothetical protein
VVPCLAATEEPIPVRKRRPKVPSSSSVDLLPYTYTPPGTNFSDAVCHQSTKALYSVQNLQSLMRTEGALHPDTEMNPIGNRSDNNIYPAFSCLLACRLRRSRICLLYVLLTSLANNITFLFFCL